MPSYPLAPMQVGMLFHSLEDSRSGIYCIVVSYRLRGALDCPAFGRAWREVVARHPILRTSFTWDAGTAPLQVVHDAVPLEVREEDWRGVEEDEQRRRLAQLLEEESRRGFDVRRPPLLRLTLARCADDVHEVVVTHHHLLMDGSCKPQLFHEVFTCYDAFREGRAPQLEPPRPYSEYIEWLRERDLDEAEAFWKQELRGFTMPTPLWPESRPAAAPEREYLEHHVELDEPSSDALRQFARRHRLTLNTLVTGSWAIVLSHGARRRDVVFGATVNGRPADLPGVESMLGLFINTLPVRVQVAPESPIVPWLQQLQAGQAGAREFDYTPLSTIQRCSGVAGGQPLFDSIVVFENNPGYGVGSERYGEIEITAVRPFIRNSLPLTVRCVPGRALAIQLLYDARRFSGGVIGGAAEEIVELLRAMPAAGPARVAELEGRLDEVERQRREREATAFGRTVVERLRAARAGRQLREGQL